ncbi:AAA family ATPase [Halomonas sp. CH40]
MLLTGVSKFSKVSLFSGLNNLRDITLSPDYAAICGYTDEDIDNVFTPELPGLDREEIRRWYNGYRWGNKEIDAVYNPFDVLLLMEECEFGPYWFESATPTFLVNLLKERGVFTP